MKLEIQGEAPFQVRAHSFSVSPSNEAYHIAYSADGINYTQYEEEVPAGETLIVNFVSYEEYIKLVGNNSKVTIIY